MITKSDLFKSSWCYEKANERIERRMGNYLYECLIIPMINKVSNCYWSDDKWLVETVEPMTEHEIDLHFGTFKGRGTLEKLIER